MRKGKLITISSRLPYRISVSRSRIQTTPSVGGLATALRSYFETTEHEFDSLHWLGVTDLSRRHFERVGEAPIEVGGITMHQFFLPRVMKEGFYDGFCNSILWPLFLYFPSFVDYKSGHFDHYIAANELACQKVLEIYEPGDTIWIHDYHWMILPSFLRRKLSTARIGFFLHIPFPSFELFRLLPKPWRDKIISGLLGADVIGFQTQDFADHFVDSVKQLSSEARWVDGYLVAADRASMVGAFPISIDYEKFVLTSKLPEVGKLVAKMRHRLGGTKMLLSVDRLDYTKAIFNRLESFELFLRDNPGFHEHVSYLVLLVPSRESILKYKENKLSVEALISRINGMYGTIGWTPIIYQYHSVDFKKLVSLYATADIALIVPARDGMNLVAKEYVASRVTGDGVLILSETAGSARELREAIMVNSNDRQQVADAILEGLLMRPEDQKDRITKMKKQIRKHDVRSWALRFLESVSHVAQQTEVHGS